MVVVMISRLVAIISVSFLVAACSGQSAPKIRAMQKQDKNRTCKELLLEMNEAQFYMKAAQRNQGPKLKNILMPLGYISTYMNAEDAIDSADARTEYLDKIYNIMDCDAPAPRPTQTWQQAPATSPYGGAAPAPVAAYPPAAPYPAPAVKPVPQGDTGGYVMPTYPSIQRQSYTVPVPRNAASGARQQYF